MKKIFPLLFFCCLIIFTCKKDEPIPDNNNGNPPIPALKNEIVDLNTVSTAFTFETVIEEEVNGVTKGTYKMTDVDDSFEDQITIGSLVLLPDEEKKLILVENVSITRSIDLTFEGVQVGLNFLLSDGKFEYSGYANRTKLAAQASGNVPQGIYTSQNPPLLESFEFEKEYDGVTLQASGEEGFVVSIDEIKLIDETNAKIKLKDVTLSVNPTYDIRVLFETMTEAEKNQYIQQLQDNSIIGNIVDFSNLVISNCKEIGMISYTDVDANWKTDIEVSGTASQSAESNKVKILSTQSLFWVGTVPVSIRTKGYLKATYQAAVNISETIDANVENNIVAGAIYDLDNNTINGITDFSIDSEITPQVTASANGYFKIEYVQEVEVYVLGLIGPAIEFNPHVAGEVYYNNNGSIETKNLGLYSSYDFRYSCDISAFHWDVLTYQIPSSLIEYESGIHIDRHYFYKLPDEIEVVSGHNQNGTTGSALSEPIRVKVKDNLGNPLYGITVGFDPVDGSLNSTTAVTDINGIAEVIWTPGVADNNGKSELTARIFYYEFVNNNFGPSVADEKIITANVSGGNFYTGDLNFTNQSEVDAFGANNYTKVIGGISISGTVSDLSPLIDLTEITGSLRVEYANSLVNLNGLDNVHTISQNLILDHCDNLTSLSGLSGLVTVYGYFNALFCIALNDFCAIQNLIQGNGLINGYTVSDNDFNPTETEILAGICYYDPNGSIYIGDVTLTTQQEVNDFANNNASAIQGSLVITGDDITDLSPLNSITSISGTFRAIYANGITDFSGMENLESIGVNFLIDQCDGLINLDGLQGLTNIEGKLEFEFCINLENFYGLNSLKNIGTYMKVDGNSSLINFDGLQSLESIQSTLTISDNINLINLNGFENLNSITSLRIEECNSLVSINALSGLTSLNGFLDISNNEILPSLQGLNNVSSIGDITLKFNNQLNSLTALSQVSGFNGNLIVWYNESLVSLNGLNSFSSEIEKLWIVENASLTDISSLSSIESVVEDVRIDGNSVLSELSGLNNINSIGEDLALDGASTFNNVDFFQNLTSVGGEISINENDSLIDLNGFSNLNFVGGDLTIVNNDVLLDLCGLTQLFQNGSFLGNFSIWGNSFNPSQQNIINGNCSQ